LWQIAKRGCCGLLGKLEEVKKSSNTDGFQDLPSYFREVSAMYLDRLKEV
jgi:hypothetical protein